MITGERECKVEQEPIPKTAWIFPGQGTQEVGMGQKLYDRYPAVRRIYNDADQILGYPISQVSFQGPESLLTQTIHAQPAIFVYNHACFSILKDQRRQEFVHPAAFVAGHSLGEYNALVAAGALTFGDALKLVQERAKAMEFACQVNPGGMLAVVDLSEKVLTSLTKEFNLEVSTINTHDQIVLGGRLEDLAEAENWLSANKHRARRLNVAGAFHTTLMMPAVGPFSKALDKTKVQNSTIPVIANTTVKVLQISKEIRKELLAQITGPVFWLQTVTYLDQQGINVTLEVGEKGILTNMNKKIVGGLTVGVVVTITGVAAAVLWQRSHQPHQSE